jgi:hypothetical protein
MIVMMMCACVLSCSAGLGCVVLCVLARQCAVCLLCVVLVIASNSRALDSLLSLVDI